MFGIDFKNSYEHPVQRDRHVDYLIFYNLTDLIARPILCPNLPLSLLL
jgi:hypothetical protein